MNKSLEEILNVEAAAGPFAMGDAVLQQTLRDFIQLQSNVISVGTKVTGVRTVSWLDFKWYTGVNGTFDYPIDDAGVADPTKVGTENYSVQLAKGQGRTVFLDSVRLRGESWETLDRQQLGIVRARADKIDNHILTTLVGGAGSTQTVSNTFVSAAGDAEKEILTAMDTIFSDGRVSGDEPMALILPASRRSAMMNSALYGNVVQSLSERLGQQADLSVYYSRDSNIETGGTLIGLLMIPGAETAEFFQYNGPGFQETEITRIPGVGFDYLLTSYMGTVIHEHQDGASAGTSNRIVKLSGV